MVDEVSRLAPKLAISESGHVSFGVIGAVTFSRNTYAVGRLLFSKNKVIPKAFMVTMASLCDLKSRIHIRVQED